MKIKNFFLSLALLPAFAFAGNLTAESFNELQKEIAQSEFKYAGRGLIFGFGSIQSCLYLSDNLAIFKNYCFPKKEYPAKGYTIISPDFGIIDLYEEEIQGIKERDIYITEFKENLIPYLTTPIPFQTVTSLSSIIEKMYNRYLPACWSTSYSDYVGGPDANCSVPSDLVTNANAWFEETQSLVNDEFAWGQMLKSVEASITQP